MNRLTKEASGRAAEVEAKLAGVLRKIDGIMRAIEDGLYQPSRSEAIRAICIAGTGQAKTPEGCAIRGFSGLLVAGTGFEPVTFRL